MAKKTKDLITMENILQFLTDSLECSQKLIATYTGLNESTISANVSKSIEEVSTKKAGKRLLSLYIVVHNFVGRGISSEIIKESLNEFVYDDLEGNADSVISALRGEKYSEVVLLNIGEMGYRKYINKLSERDNLYQAVRKYAFMSKFEEKSVVGA